MLIRLRAHALVFLAVCLVGLTGAYEGLRNLSEDYRSEWFKRPASGNTVIVAIDSASIEKLGTWPWSRDVYARAIEKLTDAGAADIAFDVDFSSPSTEQADRSFEAALKNAKGSVILPAFEQVENSRLFLNRPLARFEKQAWTGLVNVAADGDGRIRSYQYGRSIGGDFIPSFAALLAGRASSAGEFGIDFGIRAETIPRLSFAELLAGGPDLAVKLGGKKIIIGGTALELGDRLNVPRGRIMAGPVLQALAAETLVQERALYRVQPTVSYALAVFIFIVMLVTWRRTRSYTRLGVLLAFSLGAEIAATLLQANVAVIFDTAFLHLVVAAYIVVIALDEIDFRGLLAKISETQFRSFAMSLNDAVICCNGSGAVTSWNHAAEKIFGVAATKAAAKPIKTFVTHCDGSPIALIGQHNIVEAVGVKADGSRFPVEVCFSSWSSHDDTHYGLLVRDITARKEAADKIKKLAEVDVITGLANRHMFNVHLESAIANSDGGEMGLVLFDLDRFKEINDTLGHLAGDKLLHDVAERVTQRLGAAVFVSRLGGDEFGLVVQGAGSRRATINAADTIVELFERRPFDVDGQLLHVRASAGAAIYPSDGRSAEDLMSNADLALYRAKGAGGGQRMLYRNQFRQELEQRLLLEAELQEAATHGQFELFYQPQVNLSDRSIAGAEALIRWRHPTRGLVQPGDFLPTLNACTLSTTVGEWVIRSACQQIKTWMDHGYAVRVGVNLAPAQLCLIDLPGQVRLALNDFGVPPHLLELEVTENIALDNEKQATRTFSELRTLGVKLAFDDFGTGYASLSSLKKFPLDVLKVDRSFVATMETSPADAAIVGATVTLSKQLGMSVIAEGVEDERTAELLHALGADQAQGYLFGRPMPAFEFEKLFRVCRSSAAARAA